MDLPYTFKSSSFLNCFILLFSFFCIGSAPRLLSQDNAVELTPLSSTLFDNFFFEEESRSLKPKSISSDVWSQVFPYLLPNDHPIQKKLDQIFSKSRVILNLKTVKKAGFIATKPRKWTHLIVATHPELKGYIFKLYLDAQHYYKQVPEYELWIRRVKGANLLRKEITKQGWTHIFKVPRKWIYPLPENPSPPKEFSRKNFILVEEDMNLYGRKKNQEIWKSMAVTKETLDSLYILLRKIGLNDCVKLDNLPFSKDGRISFIDTQSYHLWPVPYKELAPYLSFAMKQYWLEKIK